MNSSPAGRGTPSTMEMERVAWSGESLVIEPRTTEFGDGGWGRILDIFNVYQRHNDTAVGADRRYSHSC